MRKFIILGAILALMALASPAQAVPLAPGATVTPTPLFGTPLSGTIVGDTGLVSFTMKSALGATTGKGKVEELVVLDSVTKKLDFVYQVSLNKVNVPKADVGRLSVFDYSKVTTDVGSQLTPFSPLVGTPGVIPVPSSEADRSLDGGTVGFNFGTALGFSQVLAGHTSAILIIKTDATLFDHLGNIAIQDGSGNTNVVGFQPVVIPEPSSMALLATGVLGLGGYVWRRRRLCAV